MTLEDKIFLKERNILIGDINLSKEELDGVIYELAGGYYYNDPDQTSLDLVRDWFKETKVLLYYMGESTRGVGAHLTIILEKDDQLYLFDGDHCSCNGFGLTGLESFEKLSSSYDFSKLLKDADFDNSKDILKIQEIIKGFYLSRNN